MREKVVTKWMFKYHFSCLYENKKLVIVIRCILRIQFAILTNISLVLYKNWVVLLSVCGGFVLNIVLPLWDGHLLMHFSNSNE